MPSGTSTDRAACARPASGRGACPRPGARVTLPPMLIVFLAALVVGFLTLVGGMFITPEWD